MNPVYVDIHIHTSDDPNDLSQRFNYKREEKDQCINLVKLRIVYRRSIDKKEFSTNKIYLYTIKGLFDYDEENTFQYGGLTLKEIKNILGVTE